MQPIINPSKKKNEPAIPETGLLLVNPFESRLANQLTHKEPFKKHFLFNSNLMVKKGSEVSRDQFFWAGPAVGAPMAAMTMEKLIALGGRRFIVMGWCGSLNESLKVGDVLLPTWGKSEEGTSAHYPVEQRAESHDATRWQLADYLEKHDIKTRQGPIWTTDAPYRETRDKVRNYGKEGLLGVDMEFAALCTLAVFRNVEMAAVMLVSDELWHDQWQPGYGQKRFRSQSKKILKLLLEMVKEL